MIGVTHGLFRSVTADAPRASLRDRSAASAPTAAAVSGGVFSALAGATHVRQRQRNRLQTVAMASDLCVAAVLLGCCGWRAVAG